MNNKIDINMRNDQYAMALLGAPIDSSLFGQISHKVKDDPITNIMFKLILSLLNEKFDFKDVNGGLDE